MVLNTVLISQALLAIVGFVPTSECPTPKVKEVFSRQVEGGLEVAVVMECGFEGAKIPISYKE